MNPQEVEFDYRRSPDQDEAQPVRHPVVVVGAGPVGLTLAVDLAQRGQRVVVLDDDHRLSSGSRAICFAKRTLEIWDRLGIGQRVVDKGVSWSVGRVFCGDSEVYRFDLLPEAGHQRPAFVNLQQYYAEAFLIERAGELHNLEIRWKNRVTGIEPGDSGALLTIETPDGSYRICADYVAACDGSRSPLRGLLGLESKGRVFQDRFLIADVQIAEALFPGDASERWFWFDPPFHRAGNVSGRRGAPSSVLLHRQPDGVWRIDFQLGWAADPETEKQPERIVPRVRAMLRHGFGREVDFELEWASVYTFACQRMERFRHGRVLFAGDSAHGVSPFGARGANSGVQDAENLGWKLAAVLRGDAPDSLLDSYSSEREFAADENILNSSRATDFITPKSEISRMFRDAVLGLARDHGFARGLVNSGRLSVPAILDGSPLSTPDCDSFAAGCTMRPGAPAADAPLRKAGRESWLLRELGAGFTLLVFGLAPAWAGKLGATVVTIDGDTLADIDGLAAARYDATSGTMILLRPDAHVAARWRLADESLVRAAIARASGQ